MPRTKRDTIKDRLSRVHQSIQNDVASLVDLADMFEPHHPDLSTHLSHLALFLVEAAKMVERFFYECYKYIPESWDMWDKSLEEMIASGGDDGGAVLEQSGTLDNESNS